MAGSQTRASPASLLETICASVRAPRGVIGVAVVGEDPHQLAGFHLPQADMMIVAGREQETVVEAEFSRWHRARMRQRFADELGCFRIPYANRIVGVNRGQQTAVMAELGAADRAVQVHTPPIDSSEQQGAVAARVEVPNAGDVVSGKGDEVSPLGIEKDPLDRSGMTKRRRDVGGTVGIPKPRRVIAAGCRDPAAVRAETHVDDAFAMRRLQKGPLRFPVRT